LTYNRGSNIPTIVQYDGRLDGNLGPPVEPGAEFGMTSGITDIRTLVSGFANSMYNVGNGCFSNMALPSYSQYEVLRCPRDSAGLDLVNPECNNGYVTYGPTGAPTTTFPVVVASDDMEFFYPWYIPPLLLFFAPWSTSFADEMKLQAGSADGIKLTAESTVFDESDDDVEQDEDIGEAQMSFKSIANDWVLARQITWTTSDAYGTKLVTMQYPFDFVLGFNQWPFNAFTFFRGCMEYKIQVDGNPAACGKAVANYFPGFLIGQETPVYNNLPTMLVRATSIPAGIAGDIVGKVPWIQTVSYLNILADPTKVQSGVFSIAVIAPIQVGASGGTGDVTLSLYVRFPDAKFKIRRPLTITPRAVVKDGFEIVEHKLQGGSFGKLDPYRNAVPTQPAVGLDLCTPKPVGHYRMAFNDREGNRMKKKNERVKLGWYLTTPTAVSIFSWTTSDAPGTVLFKMPMTVCPTQYNTGTLFADEIVSVTSMEYVARLRDQYRYKRLRLRVEVICTKFHVGKLAVIARYGTTSDPTNVFEGMTTMATTIDAANGSNVYDFYFKWVSDRKWLLTPQRGPFSGSELDFILGNIYILVSNPIQVNDLITSEIRLLTYLSVEGYQGRSGSTAVQLGCPSNTFNMTVPGPLKGGGRRGPVE